MTPHQVLHNILDCLNSHCLLLMLTFCSGRHFGTHLSQLISQINLTDVQKFSYLRSLLESDAVRTIDGFPLTNANYARAVDLLKKRYGQQHMITHATMQAFASNAGAVD